MCRARAPSSPRVSRHAALREAGVHVKIVQGQLGHATVTQAIDTYSFAIPYVHEAAAQTVAAFVDGLA